MGAIAKIERADDSSRGIGKMVDGLEVFGPDLRKLPPLADYLARLDAVVGDPDAYAEEWLAASAEMSGGAGAFLMWDPHAGDDDEPILYGGFIACDDLEAERRLRSDALREHKPDTPEVREAIIALLRRRGAYSDNRPAARRDVFKAMRGFIENRGRLMLNPTGGFEVGGCWPAHRDDDRTDDQLDDALDAMLEIHRLGQRWRGRDVIKRTIRTLGKPVNGWLVLEARP